MAFPTRSTPLWTLAAASTRTFTVNLPSTIEAGDLLTAIVGMDNGPGTAVLSSGPTDSTSDAWSDLISSATNVNRTGAAYYKIADGDEDSGTLTVTYTDGFTGEDCIAAVIRTPASSWHGTTPPEATAWQAETNTITADLPTLNPANWDAEDTLWLALVLTNAPYIGLTWTAPTNYTFTNTEGQDWETTGTGGDSDPKLAIASRELNAASEGGGAWTVEGDSTDDHLTAMIAVRPAAAATDPASLTESPLTRSRLTNTPLVRRSMEKLGSLWVPSRTIVTVPDVQFAR